MAWTEANNTIPANQQRGVCACTQNKVKDKGMVNLAHDGGGVFVWVLSSYNRSPESQTPPSV